MQFVVAAIGVLLVQSEMGLPITGQSEFEDLLARNTGSTETIPVLLVAGQFR